jgi:hypothetical protein
MNRKMMTGPRDDVYMGPSDDVDMNPRDGVVGYQR